MARKQWPLKCHGLCCVRQRPLCCGLTGISVVCAGNAKSATTTNSVDFAAACLDVCASLMVDVTIAICASLANRFGRNCVLPAKMSHSRLLAENAANIVTRVCIKVARRVKNVWTVHTVWTKGISQVVLIALFIQSTVIFAVITSGPNAMECKSTGPTRIWSTFLS